MTPHLDRLKSPRVPLRHEEASRRAMAASTEVRPGGLEDPASLTCAINQTKAAKIRADTTTTPQAAAI